MANQWFFAREGKNSGPWSAAQLQDLAASGQIQPEDVVWKEGMQNRVLAARVKALFPAAPLPVSAGVGGGQPQLPLSAEVSLSVLPTEVANSANAGRPAAKATPLGVMLASSEQLELAGEENGSSPATVASAPAKPAGAQPQQAKKRRILTVKGGVILSQDGAVLKYRKTCLKCGYADTSTTTMPIRSGVTRVNFFCPKCKKSHQVEIHGVG